MPKKPCFVSIELKDTFIYYQCDCGAKLVVQRKDPHRTGKIRTFMEKHRR